MEINIHNALTFAVKITLRKILHKLILYLQHNSHVYTYTHRLIVSYTTCHFLKSKCECYVNDIKYYFQQRISTACIFLSGPPYN